jgi:hypothetical protein
VLFQLEAEPGRYRVFNLQEGKKLRLYVMERDGRPSVISIVALSDGFEASAAAAEAIVETVDFRP